MRSCAHKVPNVYTLRSKKDLVHMHIFRPWRKHVQSFKKIGIKLYEELCFKVPTVYTLRSKKDLVHKVEKVTKINLTIISKSYHDENTCKVSKRLVENCKRSCAHKTPRVNADGWTDRWMAKRTETCTPKSPMLKQVQQKENAPYQDSISSSVLIV